MKSFMPPVLRIDGDLVPQDKLPNNTPEDLEAIFESMTTKEQQNTFARDLELDFIYVVPELARFRVSAAKQKGTISLAIRLIPFKVYPIEVLGLPLVLKDLALKPRGLILVTGTTGSGKSTTLAAMINHLNENERRHVLTIEDPIEFVHEGKKGIIAQRDLGGDTKSFSAALIHALRHDPDVIVVGEMRDLETISTAITAAETGHLVMSTLHTTSAAQTIDRIIDVFPPNQQPMVKVQLSQVLEAVISQVLLRRVGGGRIAGLEILISTPAVRNLIREGKNFQLPSVMQLGSKDHMQTLNQSLADLVKKKVVEQSEALSKSSDPDALRKLIQAPTNTI
jgi:twitching motility protein PilT